MKVLGVIPARGGSKRVPRKNVKLLDGKPLIQYTIEAVQQSQLIHDHIISTDDQEIAEIGRLLGGNAPFLRPSELSTDESGDIPYLKHAVRWYEGENGYKIDAVCILRPTSPFRNGSLIDDCIKKLSGHDDASSLRTMTTVEGVHHPYWMFKNVNGEAKPVIEGASLAEFYQSQLLPPILRLNGCVDLVRRDTLFDENSDLFGDKMLIQETNEHESHDIDTLQDFEYCEWLLSKT